MGLIKKRILIIGCNGLLGQALVNYYSKRNDVELHLASIEDSFVGDNQFTYSKVDISKRNEVKKIFLDFFPDVVINAAAYTDVDGCEVNKELLGILMSMELNISLKVVELLMLNLFIFQVILFLMVRMVHIMKMTDQIQFHIMVELNLQVKTK
jgi:hypothetical protein